MSEFTYYDAEGNEISAHKLVRADPDWAANNIDYLRTEKERLQSENAELRTVIERVEKAMSEHIHRYRRWKDSEGNVTGNMVSDDCGDWTPYGLAIHVLKSALNPTEDKS